MKPKKLVETKNVKEALSTLQYLKNRPVTEMVGLGLFYGAPGLGKTRLVKRLNAQLGAIYIRISSSTTTKSFAIELQEKLLERIPDGQKVKGATNRLFNNCLELIDMSSDVVIFIDEIDYAFKKKTLLGMIRDIVDETIAIVILVGMADAKNMLERASEHYFDRCNAFVQFKKLSLEDMKLVCNEVSDVKLDEKIIEGVHKGSEGTLRKAVKRIYSLEIRAKALGKKELTLNDLRG